jgi:hypothetical protein
VIKFCLLWLNLFADSLRFLILGLRSRSSLAAENLSCANSSRSTRNAESDPPESPIQTRLTLLWLSRWFNWRSALTVVTPKLGFVKNLSTT